jgi:hypothetical protein
MRLLTNKLNRNIFITEEVYYNVSKQVRDENLK